MHIDQLVIEVTRRCNLACRHCMRGDPQKVDIKEETIDKALEGVTEIGTITFSGGEPTLAVGKIRYIYKQIKKRRIFLGGFYVVTNGKIASKELMRVLIDLHAYIDFHDEYNESLVISWDQYHNEVLGEPKEADQLYSALSFYRPKERTKDINMPINEGRAVSEGLGIREAYLEPFVIETDKDGFKRIQSTIYVNVLGDVIPSCDMSYESQEKNKVGNVHENTIVEIVDKTIEIPAFK
jgi:hypothetical protein